MPSSFPFIGGELLLCFQEAALEHSQAPLPSVHAPHGIPRSWALSILPRALLKSRVFVLLLVFSILRRLLNTTALRSALGVAWSHNSCSGSSERGAAPYPQQQPSWARSWRVTRAAALFSQQAARQSKSHPGRPTSVFLRLSRAAEARFLLVASVGMGRSAADPPWWRCLRCNPEPSGRAFGVSVAPGGDSSSSASLPVALKELVASPAMQGYCQSSQCCLVDQKVRVCHPRSTTAAARMWPGMGMECPETCVPCLR